MFPFPIVPPGDYRIGAADFDGTTTYIAKNTSLSSISDSTAFTMMFWCYIDSTTGTPVIFHLERGGAGDFVISLSSGKLKVFGKSGAGTTILDINSTNTISTSGWVCVMISIDMTNTSNRYIYFGDTAETLVVTTYTNSSLDFTGSAAYFGADDLGGNKVNGGFADFLFFPGQFLDLSQTSNRRLFLSNSGKPVDPTKSGGLISTLGAPNIFFHINNSESADNFRNNDDGGAVGGAFTDAGSPTKRATSPSD